MINIIKDLILTVQVKIFILNNKTSLFILFIFINSIILGLNVVKKDIANFITKRDGGLTANEADIYLTTGASDGIKVNNIIF